MTVSDVFKGVGVFFNQMVDLERIGALADAGKIQWITPIMAPDQSSVQTNRQEWAAWRKRMPNVLFMPWIVGGDDPEEDAANASWVVSNYPSDGVVMNCEKSYESTGKWRGRILTERMMSDPKLTTQPKLLSSPSTPAERFDMDYRTFERAGFLFGPQAYWNEYPAATPKALYDSMYLPKQLHVDRDYRIQIGSQKYWGRILEWDGGNYCILKNLASAKLFRVSVVRKQNGDYIYMEAAIRRRMFDYKTGKIESGKILGFQAKDKIYPTVGVYGSGDPVIKPTPFEVKLKLDIIPNLTGASLYLGDTSDSAHVEAIWNSINQ